MIESGRMKKNKKIERDRNKIKIFKKKRELEMKSIGYKLKKHECLYIKIRLTQIDRERDTKKMIDTNKITDLINCCFLRLINLFNANNYI